MIPTHNRRDRLPKLLQALPPQPAEEFVFVVNGSNDGSLELLEAYAAENPRIEPIAIPTPSRAAALQAGVEAARAEIVLILDDDVLPEPGLVDGHARRHSERRNLVVVGYMPMTLPERRRSGEYPSYLYADSYERVCAGYEQDPTSVLDGLWEGNMSMRREDALRVGLNPSAEMPNNYWYHRDRDFGLRCRAAGLEAVFDRTLLARHEHRATRDSFLRTARDSGYTRWAVHSVHADRLGALPDDFFERTTPLPGRLLVRLARHRSLQRMIVPLLGVLAKATGSLRLHRLETHCGYLMGKIEQQRGAMDAMSSTGTSA